MIRLKVDQKSVDEAIAQLRKIPEALQAKERKKILTKAAKPLIEAARSNIRNSRKVHFRYKQNQKGKRSGKGSGTIIATYSPGNLARSIRILPIKGVNVFVGPKFAKKPSGSFAGAKVDGYYGAMVEYGTKYAQPKPYLRPAYESTRQTIMDIIKKGVEDALKKYL